MTMVKYLIEPIIVYTGSFITITLGVVGPSGLATTKDLIMILVGLATFIYTIMKIIELRTEIKKERAKKEKAQNELTKND